MEYPLGGEKPPSQGGDNRCNQIECPFCIVQGNVGANKHLRDGGDGDGGQVVQQRRL
jgi:hypothetical protein